MLRRKVNEARIAFEIQTVGTSPLLVKDGRFDSGWKEANVRGDRELAKRVPSMVFISRSSPGAVWDALRVDAARQVVAARNLDFYIPGASLRGAWRSHLERSLRSLSPEAELKVCDPLLEQEREHQQRLEQERQQEQQRQGQTEPTESNPPEDPAPDGPQSCSHRLANEAQGRPDLPYALSCPVCRLFGNSAQAGRLTIADADLVSAEPEFVDSISISRFTGSVVGNFRMLALRDAKFTTTLRLQNFELWQLGLLGHLIQDIQDGLVPLGSAKNRGFGSNTVAVHSVSLTEYGSHSRWGDRRLRGLAEVEPAEHTRRYDWAAPAADPPAVELEAAGELLWRRDWLAKNPAAFFAALRPCFDAVRWNAFETLAALDERAHPQEAST